MEFFNQDFALMMHDAYKLLAFEYIFLTKAKEAACRRQSEESGDLVIAIMGVCVPLSTPISCTTDCKNRHTGGDRGS